MKNILLVILSVFIYNFSFSQNSFKVIYEKFQSNPDPIDVELIYNDGLTKYTFEQKKEVITRENFRSEKPYHYLEFYYNTITDTVSQYRILSDKKTEIYSSFKNDIEWELTDETKIIGEYVAQKAIRYNDKSDYFGNTIAWFTEEVPVSVGPSIYMGLPGLILEVSYSKAPGFGHKFKAIEFTEQEPIEIKQQGIKVSKTQIQKPNRIDKKWLKKQKAKQ